MNYFFICNSFIKRFIDNDSQFPVKYGGLTITEAAGTGKQKGKEGLFRDTAFQVQLLPKIKIEIVVEEQKVEEIIKLINTHCNTGNIGDRKIFVSPIEQTIRIRTGEKGKKSVL
ncbi:P-II family nitrogen regulator [Cerasibacillus sp. JNUCC 74]